MPPFIRYLIYRILTIPITLLVVTLVLYGIVMLTPAEDRAMLYLPSNLPSGANLAQLIENAKREHHLDAPFPVQYGYWMKSLVEGSWGYSPTLRQGVIEALLQRTPVTAELTIYSLLLFIPVGLVTGVLAGWRKGKPVDTNIRMIAFIATSVPLFILALIFLALFYVVVYWFPPDRLSISNTLFVNSDKFNLYTGLLTVDGLLNGRPDISLDALRHLVLPVVTLSLAHWATLARVTRAATILETGKDYVIALRARGVPEKDIAWRHTFRNTLTPALTGSTLGAAALVTGIYVVEVIYNFHGVSELIVSGMEFTPDAPAALGFAIYSVMVVLLLMLILDIIQAIFDPRIREGVVK